MSIALFACVVAVTMASAVPRGVKECFRLQSRTLVSALKSLRIFAHRPANVWLKSAGASDEVTISVLYDEGDISQRNFTVATVLRGREMDVAFAEPNSALHNASTQILTPLSQKLCEATFDELPRPHGPPPASWAVPTIAALSTQNLLLAGAVAIASHIHYVSADSEDGDFADFTTVAGSASNRGGSVYGVDADVRGGLIWAAQESGLRPELVSTERLITLIVSAPSSVNFSVAVPMNSPVRAVTNEHFRSVVVDVVHDCSSDALACAEDCVPWTSAALPADGGVVPGFCTCVDNVRNLNNVSDLFDILCESDFRFGHFIDKKTTTVPLPILPTPTGSAGSQTGTTTATVSTSYGDNTTSYYNYCMEEVREESCSRAVVETADCLCSRKGMCSVEPPAWLQLPAAIPTAAFFLPNEFYRPLCAGNDSDTLLPVRIGAALLAPLSTSRSERDLQLRVKSRHTRNLAPTGVVCVKMELSASPLALASLSPCAASRQWGDDNCTLLCPRKRSFFCPERADILRCLVTQCGERHHATIAALRDCRTYCSDLDQCTAKTTFTVRMTNDNEILPTTPCVERTNVSFVCANVSTATGLFGLTIEEHSVVSIVDLDESFITVAFSALGVAVVVVACAGLLLFLGLRDLKRSPSGSGLVPSVQEMTEVHVVPVSNSGSNAGASAGAAPAAGASVATSTDSNGTRESASTNSSTLALARQALEASREQQKRLAEQQQLQLQQQQEQLEQQHHRHEQQNGDEQQRHHGHRRRRRRSTSHAYDTVPAANDDSDTPNSGDLSRPSTTTTSGGSGLSQFHTVTWASIHMGERLGAGAFGEVFKAAYRGEIVAVKRLSLSPSASDEARQRASAAFRRECETMRRVPPHRNVLALWGVVADDPPAWIAEYCAGGSLDLYVNRKRPSYRHILVMARDIADGVAHLHKHSVVHRDLAARNLLRTDKRVIKVADFGLARESPNDDFVAVGSTSVGAGAGAAKWSAPEAIENGVYTKASDVWSYGIVLWELVSGKKPYSEMMGAAAAVAIVSRRARLERPADDRCTDDLWALMQRCWADAPEDRPTMVEVRDQLALMIADNARL